MTDRERQWARRFAWWYGRVAVVSFCFGIFAGIGVAEVAKHFDYHYPALVVAFCLGAGMIYLVYLADRWQPGKRPRRDDRRD